MSMAAPPAPHAKWPPFFQAAVVEPPQSIFHPSHWLPSRESIADPRNQSSNRSARCVNMTVPQGERVTALRRGHQSGRTRPELLTKRPFMADASHISPLDQARI